MVIARGLMQISRITVLRTVTNVIVYTGMVEPPFSQTFAPCGSTVNFSVTVSFFNPDGSPQTGTLGTAYIIDILSNPNLDINQAIASGPVMVSGVTSIVTLSSAVLNNAIYSFVAVFSGLVNSSARSQSTSNIFTLNATGTETTITPVYGDNLNNFFCYNYPFTAQAHVTDPMSNNITSGNVQFVLIKDAGSSTTNLGTSALNGSGIAQITIPAYASTSPQTMILQATYLGVPCYSSSMSDNNSPSSTITSIQNNPTTTSVVSVGSTTFCRRSAHTYNVTVTPTGVSHLTQQLLDIGSIQLKAVLASGGTPFNIGPATAPIDGLASIIVPALAIPTADNYNVTAHYTTDGYCYLSSFSSNLAITTTEKATAGSTDIPGSFDRTLSQTFNFTITSGTAGTITGSAMLTSNVGGVSQGPVAVSGAHTGAIATFNILANTFTTGVQTITCTFTGDSPGNCYGDCLATNPVTVT